MTNQGRLIQEVALGLGLTQKQVLEVVSSQTALARQAIQKKEPTSVYLRQVGTFMSPEVFRDITRLKIANKQERQSKQQEQVEVDPLRFD